MKKVLINMLVVVLFFSNLFGEKWLAINDMTLLYGVGGKTNLKTTPVINRNINVRKNKVYVVVTYDEGYYDNKVQYYDSASKKYKNASDYIWNHIPFYTENNRRLYYTAMWVPMKGGVLNLKIIEPDGYSRQYSFVP